LSRTTSTKSLESDKQAGEKRGGEKKTRPIPCTFGKRNQTKKEKKKASEPVRGLHSSLWGKKEEMGSSQRPQSREKKEKGKAPAKRREGRGFDKRKRGAGREKKDGAIADGPVEHALGKEKKEGGGEGKRHLH